MSKPAGGSARSWAVILRLACCISSSESVSTCGVGVRTATRPWRSRTKYGDWVGCEVMAGCWLGAAPIPVAAGFSLWWGEGPPQAEACGCRNRGSVGAQGFEGLGAGVVDGPEGVQGGQAEQLAGLGGGADQDHLAAVPLDEHVAAEQERQEHRAEVLDLAEVDDQPCRRVLL